jgi:26S proteasome regulatory subunit T1
VAYNFLRDIQVLKTYGAAPYGAAIKKLEQQIKEKQQSVDEKIGVKVCNALAYLG